VAPNQTKFRTSNQYVSALPERKPYFEDLSIDSPAPDYPVSLSFADYLAARDPAMDVVSRLAAAKTARP
jgi:hypothetical protein